MGSLCLLEGVLRTPVGMLRGLVTSLPVLVVPLSGEGQLLTMEGPLKGVGWLCPEGTEGWLPPEGWLFPAGVPEGKLC